MALTILVRSHHLLGKSKPGPGVTTQYSHSLDTSGIREGTRPRTPVSSISGVPLKCHQPLPPGYQMALSYRHRSRKKWTEPSSLTLVPNHVQLPQAVCHQLYPCFTSTPWFQSAVPLSSFKFISSMSQALKLSI